MFYSQFVRRHRSVKKTALKFVTIRWVAKVYYNYCVISAWGYIIDHNNELKTAMDKPISKTTS